MLWIWSQPVALTETVSLKPATLDWATVRVACGGSLMGGFSPPPQERARKERQRRAARESLIMRSGPFGADSTAHRPSAASPLEDHELHAPVELPPTGGEVGGDGACVSVPLHL